MPPLTLDRVAARVARLKKNVAERAAKLDAAKRRRLVKRLKRAQRRRRLMQKAQAAGAKKA